MKQPSVPILPPELPPYLMEGVRFACTECGACCSGAPGRVQLRQGELERIAQFLGQTTESLATWALGATPDTLREEANGDCVFLRDKRCSIHPVKPAQCRLYPFWFRNVRSLEAWERTQAECPGIGQGPLITPKEILDSVAEDLDR